MTSAAVRGLKSMPMAPATLFVPQPMSSMRGAVCCRVCCDVCVAMDCVKLSAFRFQAIINFVDFLPLLFSFKLYFLVLLRGDELQLFQHFFIILVSLGIQLTAFESLLHSAIRLF